MYFNMKNIETIKRYPKTNQTLAFSTRVFQRTLECFLTWLLNTSASGAVDDGEGQAQSQDT